VATANQQIDRDVVYQMLMHISAYDRGTWVKVGMGLKSEFGDSGFSLFDEWSKSAENYDHKALIAAWRSFSGGTTTIGTLIYLSKENGYASGGDIKSAPKPSKAPAPIKQDTRTYGLRLCREANTSDSVVAQHQYAISKGIGWAAGAGRGTASGIVIGRGVDCIIVPIRNIETNKIQSVQCVNGEGAKQNFGSISGGALILGNTLDESLVWYVCEGWASAVSIVFHHQNGNGVCAACFGKTNLDSAAKLLDKFHKPLEIIKLREVDQ
jgi:hypothetical protein